MVTGQGCGMDLGGCGRLRTVHCMDPGQVTDLLSRAHTCLWEREGLLLSCHGLRLFSNRLTGGGDRWRSKHRIEVRPQVRAWSPSLDGDLEPVIGVEWVGLACAWGVSEACVFGVPS
jgi:hypothetical protein